MFWVTTAQLEADSQQKQRLKSECLLHLHQLVHTNLDAECVQCFDLNGCSVAYRQTTPSRPPPGPTCTLSCPKIEKIDQVCNRKKRVSFLIRMQREESAHRKVSVKLHFCLGAALKTHILVRHL